jgi:hypothetical protein
LPPPHPLFQPCPSPLWNVAPVASDDAVNDLAPVDALENE